MIHAGICDDVQVLSQELLSALKGIFADKKTDARFSLFLSGKELLKQAETFDIVFLDLEMPEMDGIEVGRQLHRINPECKIVIVSGMDHRIKDGYHVGATRFVSKPVQMEELLDAVEAVTKKPFGEDRIRLYFENMPYHEKQNTIHYLETDNGHTRIYTAKKEYRRSEALKSIMEELDPRLFVRISSHQVVNLQWIRPEADYSTLFIADRKLFISRRHREEFRRKFMDFDLYGRN